MAVTTPPLSQWVSVALEVFLSITTIVIIILLVALLGGGRFYFTRRG